MIVQIYLWVFSCASGLGGDGPGCAPQPVVPTPKDKSGAPPVRSIHADLITATTPLSAHRKVSKPTDSCLRPTAISSAVSCRRKRSFFLSPSSHSVIQCDLNVTFLLLLLLLLLFLTVHWVCFLYFFPLDIICPEWDNGDLFDFELDWRIKSSCMTAVCFK